MPREQPRSIEAERRLVTAGLSYPDKVIPMAQGRGLSVEDFHWIYLGWMWEGIVALRDDGDVVTPETLYEYLVIRDRWNTKVQKLLKEPPEVPLDEVETWIKIVISKAVRREEILVGRELITSAYDEETDPQERIVVSQSELDRLSTRYVRMRNPLTTNPADQLEGADGWFTFTGIPFIDEWLRLVSGELHFIAGDPGAGKTTGAIQMATANVRGITIMDPPGFKPRPPVSTVIIAAETDQLEIKMGMLLQTGKLDASFAQRIRYDFGYRTKNNLKKVRDLWDEYYGDLPIRIYRTSRGEDEVVSIVSSITEPSLVIIDHAFAIVGQSEAASNMREYQRYISLFSKTLQAVSRNNHVGVMLNQYTKGARQEEERGPDAQFGGSVVQNIASTMIHLWSMNLIDAMGNKMMRGKCWKARATILVDENGHTIDPREKYKDYWIETRHRRIVEGIAIV